MKKVLAMSSLAVLLGAAGSVDAMRATMSAVFGNPANTTSGQPVQMQSSSNQHRHPARVDQSDESVEQDDTSHSSHRHGKHQPVSTEDNRRGGGKPGKHQSPRPEDDQSPVFSVSQGGNNVPLKSRQTPKVSPKVSKPEPAPVDSNRFSKSQDLNAKKKTPNGSKNFPKSKKQDPLAKREDQDQSNYSGDGGREYSDQEAPATAANVSRAKEHSKELIRALTKQKLVIESIVRENSIVQKRVNDKLKAVDQLLRTFTEEKDKLARNASLFDSAMDEVQSLINDLEDEAKNLKTSVESLRRNDEIIQSWIVDLKEARDSAIEHSQRLRQEVEGLQPLLDTFKGKEQEEPLIQVIQQIVVAAKETDAIISDKRSEVESLLRCFNEKVEEVAGLQDKALGVRRDIDKLQKIFNPEEDENANENRQETPQEDDPVQDDNEVDRNSEEEATNEIGFGQDTLEEESFAEDSQVQDNQEEGEND